jgi:DNA-binding MarR family transcriptional regulator
MDESLTRLESQMLVLARRIETSARHSTMYERMDRAAYAIARTLDRRGPLSVNELARSLSLDGSTVTRQVAAMEARRHAIRKADPEDRRAWVISLTTPGREEMSAITEERRRRFADWVADWRPADVERFGILLQRFNAAMTHTDEVTALTASPRS